MKDGLSSFKNSFEVQEKALNEFAEQAKGKIIEQQDKSDITDKLKEQLENLEEENVVEFGNLNINQ